MTGDYGWLGDPVPALEGAACKGMTKLYFPISEDKDAVIRCRAVCATCPVLDECVNWVREYPRAVQYGIVAGYTTKQRESFARGRYKFFDWRQDPTSNLPYAHHRGRPKTLVDGRQASPRMLKYEPCPNGHGNGNLRRYANRIYCMLCDYKTKAEQAS